MRLNAVWFWSIWLIAEDRADITTTAAQICNIFLTICIQRLTQTCSLASQHGWPAKITTTCLALQNIWILQLLKNTYYIGIFVYTNRFIQLPYIYLSWIMINILKTRCMGYQVIPAISQHLPYFTFSETCNCHAVSKFVRMFCGGTDVLKDASLRSSISYVCSRFPSGL